MNSIDLGDLTIPAAGWEHPTPYDEYRYPGRFYPQASPERMAALATLFGLSPAPVERCRVLELGCGEGGHLVPLAYMLPESTFLGIDLSPASIARATALAGRLTLSNVSFRAQDLTEFSAAAGDFDYIIAHGLYSWVPEAVQQAILAICGRHLAPGGVAYISYNTYPAGHLRQIPRDLTLFHTRGIADPAAKVREARNIAEFIVAAMPEATLERELLRKTVAQYALSDPLMRFDLLSEVNEPVYFLDFIEQAAASGLQFVAESDTRSMGTAHLPESARTWLERIPERLLREQYLDFIQCRGFRKTILCREEHQVDLEVTPQRMERLLVAGSLQPLQPLGDLHGGEAVEFRTCRGFPLVCTDALPKAIYLTLGESFPRALPYRELRARACRRLGWDLPLGGDLEKKLIQMLVSSLINGVVEFHVYQPPFATRSSEKPVASAMARVQAETGDPVSSMSMNSFVLDPFVRSLLLLLDGSRDRQQLLADLRLGPEIGSGELSGETLDKALQTLAQYGMLIG